MTQTDNFKIRALAALDFEAWLPLWQSNLRQNQTRMTRADCLALFQGLTGAKGDKGALIAQQNGALQGLLHYQIRRTGFAFEAAFCIQDLFVLPNTDPAPIRLGLVKAIYDLSWAKCAPIVFWKTAERGFGPIARTEAAAASAFLTYQKAA